MPAVMEHSTVGPASTPAEHREKLGGNFMKGRKGKLDLFISLRGAGLPGVLQSPQHWLSLT